MRLWHKELIQVLPRQQLLGQWRECCLIARNISIYGKPRHLLVDKIMNYPLEHFLNYADIVSDEMDKRGYECNFDAFWKWTKPYRSFLLIDDVPFKDLFYGWHDERYFWQCYYNLEEKYDCGNIPKEEWKVIDEYCISKL